MKRKQFKFVVVGDSDSGKTSLITAQAGGEFNEGYVPTAFDDYAIEACISGKTKLLTVCDTSGDDSYDSLRPLSYPDTDVFLVCYPLDQPERLRNVHEKWIKEIQKFCPSSPVVIVGTKKDRLKTTEQTCDQSRPSDTVEPKSSESDMRDVIDYPLLECSAKTKEGVKQVFDTAVRIAMSNRAKRSHHVLSSMMKLKLVF